MPQAHINHSILVEAPEDVTKAITHLKVVCSEWHTAEMFQGNPVARTKEADVCWIATHSISLQAGFWLSFGWGFIVAIVIVLFMKWRKHRRKEIQA